MRIADRGMPNRIKKQRGVSLIAAIFIIVVLAFMGLMLLSLFAGGSMTAVNEMQASRALYIAEGGEELLQRDLALNLDWYRSTADPVASAVRSLGTGSFSASTTVPATMLRNRLKTGVFTAMVYTTGRFPSAGYLQIEDDMAGSAEFVQYTGTTGNSFTGLTRGITIGTVTNGAGNHGRGSRVYPVTTLMDALANSCASPASFRVAANTKFLSGGTLDIEGEEIGYTGSGTAAGVMTLTGIGRCQNATASAAHAIGQPVTPILWDGTSPDFEAEIMSLGAANNAVRTERKTVQR